MWRVPFPLNVEDPIGAKFLLSAALLLGSLGCNPTVGETAGAAQLPPAGPPPAEAPLSDAPANIEVNGVRLHYVERGAGEPVVFVHGGLVDYREWEPVADALAGEYHTLVYSRRYNFPNDNPFAGPDHSAAVEAEDLAALIRARGLAPANVVGVSYGGYTGLILALRYPELVRSLVVVETAPLVRWLPDLPGGSELSAGFFDRLWGPVGDAFRRGDREGALRVTLDYFAFPGAMDQIPPGFRTMLEGNLREWEALATSSDAFPPITRAELARLEQPVLVLSGERGLDIARLTDPELARALRRGEHLVIPGGTHDVCSEEPAVCAQAIRSFLAQD